MLLYGHIQASTEQIIFTNHFILEKELQVMKPITQSYTMKASPEQVFQALTDQKMIEGWSGAPATMNSQVGTEFTLFGGNITGKNLEVVPNQKLVQEWTEGSWETPSKVIFTLTGNGGETTLELHHEGVPEADQEKIIGGWKEFYLGQIQKMFAE